MEIALVVAHDRNRAIGRAGQLPWQLPDDLKHFKALTMGLPVLMGRRTFESIGRALPGRRNLVLSRNSGVRIAGVEVLPSLATALTAAAGGAAPTLMVIGGGDVYAQALPCAQRIHLTAVDVAVEGADAWFPALDRAQWQEVRRIHHPADARHAHAFDLVELTRRY